MDNFINLLFQPFRNFWASLAAFLPNLFAMLLIILSGLLIAWLARKLFLRLFTAINFDVWCDKAGLTAIIRKGDIWTRPSDFFGRIIYLIFIIIFLMIGLSALRLPTIGNLTSQFFLYMPRALSALFILIIGYIIAGFVARGILIAAVNSGYHYAKLLAEAVRVLLIVLILAMALEQFGIAPGVVIAAFSIIFGGIVLSLAIAFGVGGIDTAKRIIEKRLEEKKEEKGNIEHL